MPDEAEDMNACRKHFRADPATLRPDTRDALLELKRCLAAEPGVLHAQVTFDNAKSPEDPPTVDLIAV